MTGTALTTAASDQSWQWKREPAGDDIGVVAARGIDDAVWETERSAPGHRAAFDSDGSRWGGLSMAANRNRSNQYSIRWIWHSALVSPLMFWCPQEENSGYDASSCEPVDLASWRFP